MVRAWRVTIQAFDQLVYIVVVISDIRALIGPCKTPLLLTCAVFHQPQCVRACVIVFNLVRSTVTALVCWVKRKVQVHRHTHAAHIVIAPAGILGTLRMNAAAAARVGDQRLPASSCSRSFSSLYVQAQHFDSSSLRSFIAFKVYFIRSAFL